MWNSALLLDANYLVHGVDATLIPRPGPTQPVAVRVIDKTIGVEITPLNSSMELPTIGPAADVRVSELNSLLVDKLYLDEGRLIMNGRTWRIKSVRERPTPDGLGELRLVLTEDSERSL